MNPHVFREYDIRGLVARDLDPGFVGDLGRAYASAVRAAGGRRVAVGMDVRDTSPPLRDALVEGILSAGVDAVVLGTVPTPVAYWAVPHLGTDGSIQVTGSHNPVEYNGFKMTVGSASLHGAGIQDLRRRIEERDFAAGTGRREDVDLLPAYVDAIVADGMPDRPLTVVVDSGNGCAGPVAPGLLRALGCTVHELYSEPDGSFPNHIPDPTLPETLVDLIARVGETGADLGLAFDGDADRLGAVDATGRILWGDQLLALFAREVLATRPGAPILFEVKCSQALREDIEAHGGKPVMVPTGHSLIKKAMRETGAPLAGEMSGHLFFADRWHGFDDALYAAARLIRLAAALEVPVGRIVDGLPVFHATPEIRVDCPDDRKFAVVEGILARYRPDHDVVTVDGARVEFGDGWGLVRASNTQPVLVVRTEGRTPEARDRILTDLREALREAGVDVPA